jgi:hypothetical protein
MSASQASNELNEGQLATSLPAVTHYLTGHDSSGKAILESVRPAKWTPFDNEAMAFNQIYTTTFPADLKDNKDIETHDELIASGKLGLVNPKGVACRMVWTLSPDPIELLYFPSRFYFQSQDAGCLVLKFNI